MRRVLGYLRSPVYVHRTKVKKARGSDPYLPGLIFIVAGTTNTNECQNPSKIKLNVSDKYVSPTTKVLSLECDSQPCSAGNFLIMHPSSVYCRVANRRP